MRSLCAIAILLLAACESDALYVSQSQMAFNAAPPSIASVRADIDANLDCGSEHIVRGNPDPRAPAFVVRCPGYFPVALQSAGVEGACVSMFDINAAGEPIRVETHCNVDARHGEPSPRWREVASEALAYSASRATSHHRFTSGKTYQNVLQPMRFQFEGERDWLALPQPFQRSGDAPLLTADIIRLPG